MLKIGNSSLVRAALALALLALAGQAQAVTEIQWWHSMTGALNDRLNDIAKRFNESQKDYKVTPVFKGSYPEAMAGAIAAYRSGSAPALLQVQEVATATMMSAKGAIKPVYQVMADAGEKFDPKAYVPAVAGYYTNPKGQMLSFPFNSSTTVFYYNKDAFEKAGLDPNRAPATWAEVVADAAKIKAAGALPCAYTTGWQSWVQLESFSAWHNVPFATEAERLRRQPSEAGVQRAAAGPAYRQHAGLGQEGLFHLRRPQERARSQVLQRRMRDADHARRPRTATSSRTRSSSSPCRRCRITPTSPARRRTPSSAARASG